MNILRWGLVVAILISNVLTAVVQISWRRVVETKLEECQEIEGREFLDINRCKSALETCTETQATVTRAVEDHLRIHNRPGGWCSCSP
jgi:hypothetical protein